MIKKIYFVVPRQDIFLNVKYFHLEYAEEEAAFQSFHETKYATIGKSELY